MSHYVFKDYLLPVQNPCIKGFLYLSHWLQKTWEHIFYWQCWMRWGDVKKIKRLSGAWTLLGAGGSACNLSITDNRSPPSNPSTLQTSCHNTRESPSNHKVYTHTLVVVVRAGLGTKTNDRWFWQNQRRTGMLRTVVPAQGLDFDYLLTINGSRSSRHRLALPFTRVS